MNYISFTPFPTLTTDRLTLRQLTDEDENAIFAIRSNEEVARFLDRPKSTTIGEVRQSIQKINQGIVKNEWISWAITLKNNDKLIGTICLWNISKGHSKAEIGYELLPKYQGQGLMQEALTKVVQYGFENMKLCTIEAFVHPKNTQSIKLLERNNFIKIGNFKENYSYENKVVDMIIYTLKKC